MNTGLPLNSVANSDCLKFLHKLPDECIDLIVTDPPYGISQGSQLSMSNIKKLEGFGGDWSIINEDWDSYTFEEYVKFIENVLVESKRVLKSEGTMIIFGTYHNIGVINFLALKIGLRLINEIIWYKRNAFPNLSRKCLTASHENILWMSKSGKWNYNYETMKQARYQFDKLKEPNKQLRSVWDIPNNKEKEELAYRKVFPDKSYWIKSQKPLRLMDRCIKLAASFDQDQYVVADWFSGSGTTLISAKLNSLNFIGCELNPKFIEVIKWRLANI
ncbi:MAG: DNA-methyltransferase, partial [Candidatus Hodarchaeales archaeon]